MRYNLARHFREIERKAKKPIIPKGKCHKCGKKNIEHDNYMYGDLCKE